MNTTFQTFQVKEKDGSVREAEIYLYFTLKSDNNDYIIYTYGEKDENNLEIIETSKVETDRDGNIQLLGVEDDAVWNEIKKVMRILFSKKKETEEGEE